MAIKTYVNFAAAACAGAGAPIGIATSVEAVKLSHRSNVAGPPPTESTMTQVGGVQLSAKKNNAASSNSKDAVMEAYEAKTLAFAAYLKALGESDAARARLVEAAAGAQNTNELEAAVEAATAKAVNAHAASRVLDGAWKAAALAAEEQRSKVRQTHNVCTATRVLP